MKTITKYFLIEIVKLYLLVLFIVLGIFSVFHFLEEIGKDYSAYDKLLYVIYTLPTAAANFFHFAIFIGTIIFLGRLIRNNELQIFLSGGFSIKEIISKCIKISFAISIFSLVSSDYFSPYFFERSNQIKSEALGNKIHNSTSNIWLIQDDKFINLNMGLEKNLTGITIYEINNDQTLQSISKSNSAEINQQNFYVNNLEKLEFNSGVQEGFRIKKFNQNTPLNIFKFNDGILDNINKDERSLTFLDLIYGGYNLATGGLDADSYISEIFNRLLRPLIAIGLIIIALPLILNFQRINSIINMIFLGVSYALLFNLFTRIVNALAVSGQLNIFISSLIPAIILTIVGLVVFVKIIRN